MCTVLVANVSLCDANPINFETKWKTRFIQLTEFAGIYTCNTYWFSLLFCFFLLVFCSQLAPIIRKFANKGVNCILRIEFATQFACGPTSQLSCKRGRYSEAPTAVIFA